MLRGICGGGAAAGPTGFRGNAHAKVIGKTGVKKSGLNN